MVVQGGDPMPMCKGLPLKNARISSLVSNAVGEPWPVLVRAGLAGPRFTQMSTAHDERGTKHRVQVHDIGLRPLSKLNIRNSLMLKF